MTLMAIGGGGGPVYVPPPKTDTKPTSTAPTPTAAQIAQQKALAAAQAETAALLKQAQQEMKTLQQMYDRGARQSDIDAQLDKANSAWGAVQASVENQMRVSIDGGGDVKQAVSAASADIRALAPKDPVLSDVINSAQTVVSSETPAARSTNEKAFQFALAAQTDQTATTTLNAYSVQAATLRLNDAKADYAAWLKEPGGVRRADGSDITQELSQELSQAQSQYDQVTAGNNSALTYVTPAEQTQAQAFANTQESPASLTQDKTTADQNANAAYNSLTGSLLHEFNVQAATLRLKDAKADYAAWQSEPGGLKRADENDISQELGQAQSQYDQVMAGNDKALTYVTPDEQTQAVAALKTQHQGDWFASPTDDGNGGTQPSVIDTVAAQSQLQRDVANVDPNDPTLTPTMKKLAQTDPVTFALLQETGQTVDPNAPGLTQDEKSLATQNPLAYAFIKLTGVNVNPAHMTPAQKQTFYVTDQGNLFQYAMKSADPKSAGVAQLKMLQTVAPTVRLQYTQDTVNALMKNPANANAALTVLNTNMNATFSTSERETMWNQAGLPHFNAQYVTSQMNQLMVAPDRTANDPDSVRARNDSTMNADKVGKWMQSVLANAPPEFAGLVVDGVKSNFSDKWYQSNTGTPALQRGVEFYKGLSEAVGLADQQPTLNGSTVHREDDVASWLLDPKSKAQSMIYILRGDSTSYGFDSIRQTVGGGFSPTLSQTVLNQMQGSSRFQGNFANDFQMAFSQGYSGVQKKQDSAYADASYRLFQSNPTQSLQTYFDGFKTGYTNKAYTFTAGSNQLSNFVGAGIGIQPDNPKAVPLDANYNPSMAMLEEQIVSNGSQINASSLYQQNQTATSMINTVTDQIHTVGGDHPVVTLVPIYYVSKDSGASPGALFKVQNKDDPSKFTYIDDRGWQYKDLSDFQHNNGLSDDGKLYVPTNLTIDQSAPGSVQYQTVAAHITSGWQHVENVLEDITGPLALAGGLVLVATGIGAPEGALLLTATVGAWTGIGAGMAVGAVASISDLSNLSDHGQSLGFGNAQARADWVSLIGTGAGVMGGGIGMVSKTLADGASLFNTVNDVSASLGNGARFADEASAFDGAANMTGKVAHAFNLIGAASGVDLSTEQGVSLLKNWDSMSDSDRAHQLFNFGLGVAQFGAGSKMMEKPIRAALGIPEPPRVAPSSVQPADSSDLDINRPGMLTVNRNAAMLGDDPVTVDADGTLRAGGQVLTYDGIPVRAQLRGTDGEPLNDSLPEGPTALLDSDGKITLVDPAVDPETGQPSVTRVGTDAQITIDESGNLGLSDNLSLSHPDDVKTPDQIAQTISQLAATNAGASSPTSPSSVDPATTQPPPRAAPAFDETVDPLTQQAARNAASTLSDIETNSVRAATDQQQSTTDARVRRSEVDAADHDVDPSVRTNGRGNEPNANANALDSRNGGAETNEPVTFQQRVAWTVLNATEALPEHSNLDSEIGMPVGNPALRTSQTIESQDIDGRTLYVVRNNEAPPSTLLGPDGQPLPKETDEAIAPQASAASLRAPGALSQPIVFVEGSPEAGIAAELANALGTPVFVAARDALAADGTSRSSFVRFDPAPVTASSRNAFVLSRSGLLVPDDGTPLPAGERPLASSEPGAYTNGLYVPKDANRTNDDDPTQIAFKPRETGETDATPTGQKATPRAGVDDDGATFPHPQMDEAPARNPGTPGLLTQLQMRFGGAPLPSEVSALAEQSGTLSQQLRMLNDKGWRVKVGREGGGSRIDTKRRRVTIDGALRKPGSMTYALAHEAQHAVEVVQGLRGFDYSEGQGRFTRKGLEAEARAQINAFEARYEIDMAGGGDIARHVSLPRQIQRIADQWTPESDYYETVGRLMDAFADAPVSGAVKQTYTEFYNDAYARHAVDGNAAAKATGKGAGRMMPAPETEGTGNTGDTGDSVRPVEPAGEVVPPTQTSAEHLPVDPDATEPGLDTPPAQPKPVAWTVPPEVRANPNLSQQVIGAALASGSWFEGVEYYIYALHDDALGGTREPQKQGLPATGPGDLLEDIKAAEHDDALAAKKNAGDDKPALTVTRYTSDFDVKMIGLKGALEGRYGIALVDPNALEPDGSVSPGAVLGHYVRNSDGSGLDLVLNPAFQHEVRIRYPSNFEPGKPLIRVENGQRIDAINALDGREETQWAAYPRRPADLAIYSDHPLQPENRFDNGERPLLPVPPGHFAVYAHAWTDAFSDPGGVPFDATEMAKRIRAAGWDGESPVILYSCGTGMRAAPMAQQLASILRVDVYGATGFVEMRSARTGEGKPGSGYLTGLVITPDAYDTNRVPDSSIKDNKLNVIRFQPGLPLAEGDHPVHWNNVVPPPADPVQHEGAARAPVPPPEPGLNRLAPPASAGELPDAQGPVANPSGALEPFVFEPDDITTADERAQREAENEGPRTQKTYRDNSKVYTHRELLGDGTGIVSTLANGRGPLVQPGFDDVTGLKASEYPDFLRAADTLLMPPADALHATGSHGLMSPPGHHVIFGHGISPDEMLGPDNQPVGVDDVAAQVAPLVADGRDVTLYSCFAGSNRSDPLRTGGSTPAAAAGAGFAQALAQRLAEVNGRRTTVWAPPDILMVSPDGTAVVRHTKLATGEITGDNLPMRAFYGDPAWASGTTDPRSTYRARTDTSAGPAPQPPPTPQVRNLPLSDPHFDFSRIADATFDSVSLEPGFASALADRPGVLGDVARVTRPGGTVSLDRPSGFLDEPDPQALIDATLQAFVDGGMTQPRAMFMTGKDTGIDLGAPGVDITQFDPEAGYFRFSAQAGDDAGGANSAGHRNTAQVTVTQEELAHAIADRKQNGPRQRYGFIEAGALPDEAAVVAALPPDATPVQRLDARIAANLDAVARSTPVEMHRLSDLGHDPAAELHIALPDGSVYVKPAGVDMYVAQLHDPATGETSLQLIHAGEHGLPEGYAIVHSNGLRAIGMFKRGPLWPQYGAAPDPASVVPAPDQQHAAEWLDGRNLRTLRRIDGAHLPDQASLARALGRGAQVLVTLHVDRPVTNAEHSQPAFVAELQTDEHGKLGTPGLLPGHNLTRKETQTLSSALSAAGPIGLRARAQFDFYLSPVSADDLAKFGGASKIETANKDQSWSATPSGHAIDPTVTSDIQALTDAPRFKRPKLAAQAVTQTGQRIFVSEIKSGKVFGHGERDSAYDWTYYEKTSVGGAEIAPQDLVAAFRRHIVGLTVGRAGRRGFTFIVSDLDPATVSRLGGFTPAEVPDPTAPERKPRRNAGDIGQSALATLSRGTRLVTARMHGQQAFENAKAANDTPIVEPNLLPSAASPLSVVDFSGSNALHLLRAIDQKAVDSTFTIVVYDVEGPLAESMLTPRGVIAARDDALRWFDDLSQAGNLSETGISLDEMPVGQGPYGANLHFLLTRLDPAEFSRHTKATRFTALEARADALRVQRDALAASGKKSTPYRRLSDFVQRKYSQVTSEAHTLAHELQINGKNNTVAREPLQIEPYQPGLSTGTVVESNLRYGSADLDLWFPEMRRVQAFNERRTAPPEQQLKLTGEAQVMMADTSMWKTLGNRLFFARKDSTLPSRNAPIPFKSLARRFSGATVAQLRMIQLYVRSDPAVQDRVAPMSREFSLRDDPALAIGQVKRYGGAAPIFTLVVDPYSLSAGLGEAHSREFLRDARALGDPSGAIFDGEHGVIRPAPGSDGKELALDDLQHLYGWLDASAKAGFAIRLETAPSRALVSATDHRFVAGTNDAYDDFVRTYSVLEQWALDHPHQSAPTVMVSFHGWDSMLESVPGYGHVELIKAVLERASLEWVHMGLSYGTHGADFIANQDLTTALSKLIVDYAHTSPDRLARLHGADALTRVLLRPDAQTFADQHQLLFAEVERIGRLHSMTPEEIDALRGQLYEGNTTQFLNRARTQTIAYAKNFWDLPDNGPRGQTEKLARRYSLRWMTETGDSLNLPVVKTKQTPRTTGSGSNKTASPTTPADYWRSVADHPALQNDGTKPISASRKTAAQLGGGEIAEGSRAQAELHALRVHRPVRLIGKKRIAAAAVATGAPLTGVGIGVAVKLLNTVGNETLQHATTSMFVGTRAARMLQAIHEGAVRSLRNGDPRVFNDAVDRLERHLRAQLGPLGFDEARDKQLALFAQEGKVKAKHLSDMNKAGMITFDYAKKQTREIAADTLEQMLSAMGGTSLGRLHLGNPRHMVGMLGRGAAIVGYTTTATTNLLTFIDHPGLSPALTTLGATLGFTYTNIVFFSSLREVNADKRSSVARFVNSFGDMTTSAAGFASGLTQIGEGHPVLGTLAIASGAILGAGRISKHFPNVTRPLERLPTALALAPVVIYSGTLLQGLIWGSSNASPGSPPGGQIPGQPGSSSPTNHLAPGQLPGSSGLPTPTPGVSSTTGANGTPAPSTTHTPAPGSTPSSGTQPSTPSTPAKPAPYLVVEGDSLWVIATSHRQSLLDAAHIPAAQQQTMSSSKQDTQAFDEILQLNPQIANPAQINPGQQIVVG